MHSRRSFFSRLGAMVAVVALAPQIAFARKLEAPRLDQAAPFWYQTTRWSRCVSDSYRETLQRLLNTPENQALMRQ